jgi:hypothetical protein
MFGDIDCPLSHFVDLLCVKSGVVDSIAAIATQSVVAEHLACVGSDFLAIIARVRI